MSSSLTVAACGDDDGPPPPDAATQDGGNTDGGADAAPPPVFELPESAVWDAAKGAWYVSNIGGTDGAAADGVGWIARLDAFGEPVNARWVDGLNAPKGMALFDGKLYVADIDQIVVVTIPDDNAAVPATEKITVPGAMFLNDVAAGGDSIYFSDTVANAIYKLTPGADPELVEFVKSDDLKNPNGVLVEADRLVIASFGPLDDTAALGQLLTVSLADKTIAQLGTFTGKLDGIEADGDTYIVSDFRGTIHKVTKADGVAVEARNTTTADSFMSAADIGFDPVRRLVAMPDLLGSKFKLVSLEFDGPESALWDADNEVWYVSNIAGSPTEKDGRGWISRLNSDGKVLEAQWVTGLNSPKGMALVNGTLYVADVDQIAVVDIDGDGTGALTTPITVQGAMLLNDIAGDADGNIFVTDTLGNTIYKVTLDGQPAAEEFVSDPILKNPNGILVEAERLLVGSIGDFTNPDEPAPFFTISLADKTITEFGDLKGKLDGIVSSPDGSIYLVSDFRGQLHAVTADDGSASQFANVVTENYLRSAADIGLDPEAGMLAIPDLLGNSVVLRETSSIFLHRR